MIITSAAHPSTNSVKLSAYACFFDDFDFFREGCTDRPIPSMMI
jgi:hypothetical protein